MPLLQLADLLLSAMATIDNDIIHTIGFDADDTLWHSETYFATTEDRFRALLEPWCSHDETSKRLLDRERCPDQDLARSPMPLLYW